MNFFFFLVQKQPTALFKSDKASKQLTNYP